LKYEKWKSTLDRSIAILLIFSFAIPAVIVAIAIRTTMGSPVLFRQRRVGRDSAEFELIKFRTMLNQSPDGPTVASADRITPLGAFLRKTSLDELPQLLNVVRGEMSLVGPRPLLVDYLELYSTRQQRRHEVMPGITGLAQTSGRSSLTWTEKFEKDVEYVETITLRGDVRILWNTINQVLRQDGVSPRDQAIAKRFDGNN